MKMSNECHLKLLKPTLETALGIAGLKLGLLGGKMPIFTKICMQSQSMSSHVVLIGDYI